MSGDDCLAIASRPGLWNNSGPLRVGVSLATSLVLNSWNYVTRPKDEQQSDAIFGGVVWITKLPSRS
ncbi:MAG: hypothetical protein WA683_18805, partial [Pseudolabrys sp.]